MNEDANAELKKLLEENIAVAKDNNRLLKLIRRDATIGLVVKVLLWLIVLGVPILFLSAYLGPIMEQLSAPPGSPSAAGVNMFGIPSPEQVEELLQEYKALYEQS